MANGILGVTLIISGINAAEVPDDVTDTGLLIMKLSMLILPLIFIVLGYIVYKRKFKIDEQMYKNIISDLEARGDIHRD